MRTSESAIYDRYMSEERRKYAYLLRGAIMLVGIGLLTRSSM